MIMSMGSSMYIYPYGVAVCCKNEASWGELQCVAVCCSVLQCNTMSGSMLQRVAACFSVLHTWWCALALYMYIYSQSVTVCCKDMMSCRVLQRVAACCCVLQCVAVCCTDRMDAVSLNVSFCKQSLELVASLRQEICKTATHYNALKRTATQLWRTAIHCNARPYTAIHYNTLQYSVTRYNALQHATTHCNALQHAANSTWCDIFENSKLKARTSRLPRFSEKRRSNFELWALKQHSKMSPQVGLAVLAMHFNALQHSCKALRGTATHCNALQCAATHCNALQHTVCIRIYIGTMY